MLLWQLILLLSRTIFDDLIMQMFMLNISKVMERSVNVFDTISETVYFFHYTI